MQRSAMYLLLLLNLMQFIACVGDDASYVFLPLSVITVKGPVFRVSLGSLIAVFALRQKARCIIYFAPLGKEVLRKLFRELKFRVI